MKVTLPIIVIAFETDYEGVVSNTRYLEYMERGRYALLQAAGLSVEQMLKGSGVQPVIRRVEIDYIGVARHEDALELGVEVQEWRGASAILAHELRRADDQSLVMRGRQTLAFINENWRPVRVPALFKQKLGA
jgi:acyl-CoA thioester hydrolase